MRQNKTSGFTLIELLVVFAIINLLATIALVNINSARIKARDVRREADIKNIAHALQDYYTGHNSVPCHNYQVSNDENGSANTDFMKFLSDLGYLKSTPQDPLHDIIYKYEYYTFHLTTDSGKCGQFAGLGYYTESPDASCPSDGLPAVSGMGGVGHCHLLIPGIPPDCNITSFNECESTGVLTEDISYSSWQNPYWANE